MPPTIITNSPSSINIKCCTAGLVVNNSAVLVDIPNLSFVPVPNSWYFIQFFVAYMASAVADLRLSIVDAGGSGGVFIDYAGNARVVNTPMNIAGAGVAAEMPWVITGYYAPGGAPGTFKLQAAQWNVEATDMTISIGSWLAFKKIA